MTQPSDNEPKPRVLVIDEDQRTADSLAFALDAFGFRATPAYSGQQAMDLAAIQSFQFVVSDALTEIKGVKAPLAISEVLPDCKVLLMSSDGDSVECIEQARAHDYRFDSFAKPVDPGLLVERLRGYRSGLQSADLKDSRRLAPPERNIGPASMEYSAEPACSYCGRVELRRSRFRVSDIWFLFLFRYPSRCRFCRERKHILLSTALKLPRIGQNREGRSLERGLSMQSSRYD
jgi:DNA-binding response OmpR family regulator